MRVYQTDEQGVFLREAAVDPDPLAPGRYLIPGGCVTEPPPKPEPGQRARWTGSAWAVEPEPAPEESAEAQAPQTPTVQNVKDEAMRRILAIAPEWRQRNLLAQAVVLARKLADGETLTVGEQVDWDAGEAIWRRINAIRAHSDAIETDIPTDFADDRHWPAERPLHSEADE